MHTVVSDETEIRSRRDVVFGERSNINTEWPGEQPRRPHVMRKLQQNLFVSRKLMEGVRRSIKRKETEKNIGTGKRNIPDIQFHIINIPDNQLLRNKYSR